MQILPIIKRDNQIRIPDTQGNEILINNGSTILLKLTNETRVRRLGIINSKHYFVVHRNRKTHLHYKTNSYGFNYYIVKNAQKFNYILLIDKSGKYLIPNNVILEQGKILQFKSEGFELQIFLTLKIIKKYKL